jgi:GYF domain 2
MTRSVWRFIFAFLLAVPLLVAAGESRQKSTSPARPSLVTEGEEEASLDEKAALEEMESLDEMEDLEDPAANGSRGLRVLLRVMLLGGIPFGIALCKGRFAWAAGLFGFCLVVAGFLGIIPGLLACGIGSAIAWFLPEVRVSAEEIAALTVKTADASKPAPDATIYLASGDQTVGPFSLKQVRVQWLSGELPKDACFWKEGMETWEPVSKLLI